MTTAKEQELKKELKEMLSRYKISDLNDISIEYDRYFDNSMLDGYKAILVIDYVFYSDLETLEQKWHITKIEGVEEALRIWLYHRRVNK